MRGILEFDLSSEADLFMQAKRGPGWARVVRELREYIREQIKYSDLDPKVEAMLELVRERITELENDYVNEV